MKKTILLVVCVMALVLSGCGGVASSNSTVANTSKVVENKDKAEEQSDGSQASQEVLKNATSDKKDDSSDAGDISNRFEVGDLTLALPDNYGYEDYSNESVESYMVFLTPEKSLADYLRIDYIRNVFKGVVTEKQVKENVEMIYTGWKETIINDIYPGATLIKEEPYTKNEEPAYHFVFSSTSSGFDFIHDVYLFMANQNDLAAVMEVHWKDSKNDFSNEFIEMIQSSKTAGIQDDVPDSLKKDDSPETHKSVSRICPNCNGSGFVKYYATDNPWEEGDVGECPMCHGTGTVQD